MKIVRYCILFLLFFPIQVHASTNLSLEDLTILNGELSIPFEPLNNEYTVILPKEEYNIEMKYKVKEGITVSVLDNYDLSNNKVVTISLIEEQNRGEYHLHILKEEEEETQTTFLEEAENREDSFMHQYKIYIIPAACFFLIYLFYKMLFRRHKK